MKKYLIFILLFLLGMFFISAKNFTVTFDFSRFFIGDSNFKAYYGKNKYLPEGKIALRLSGNIYLWSSFSYLQSSYSWEEWSNKGVVEADVEGKNTLDKFIISGGVGYYIGYLSKNQFSIKAEIGLCRIVHSIESIKLLPDTNEKLFTETEEEAGLGIRGNLGITYGFYKNFFLEVNAGYMFVTDKVEDVRINLGGFRVALGLGFTF